MSDDDGAATTAGPGRVPGYGVGPMADLVDHWGLLLTYGLVTIGLGVVLAAWPDETLKVVAILIGIQLIITGVFRIVLAIASRLWTPAPARWSASSAHSRSWWACSACVTPCRRSWRSGSSSASGGWPRA